MDTHNPTHAHLSRSPDGVWTADLACFQQPGAPERPGDAEYRRAFPRYMTALDPVFLRARECSQFWLIWSLLGVRSLQDLGWDPYESTIGAIDALVKVHALADGTAQGHLQLMIYGHIVEASEPYELLANLVDIGQGGMFLSERFPPGKDGRPLSPGTKIAHLKDAAAGAGLLAAIDPLNEIWDRDLRNSVFHADYALYRGEVRIMHPTKVYRHENVLRLVNSALA